MEEEQEVLRNVQALYLLARAEREKVKQACVYTCWRQYSDSANTFSRIMIFLFLITYLIFASFMCFPLDADAFE